MTLTRELPRYTCSKTVHALQVAHLIQNPRGHELHFVDKGFAPHEVPGDWAADNIEPGDYFVINADGSYTAMTARDFFKAGFVLIEPPKEPT